MTDLEKRAALAAMIAPDTDTDEVLDSMLTAAESLILNRMYPFGYEEDTAVPVRYENIQVQLATELFTRRGAEGEASHTENGTTITWPSRSRLLDRIMPHCGSVN